MAAANGVQTQSTFITAGFEVDLRKEWDLVNPGYFSHNSQEKGDWWYSFDGITQSGRHEHWFIGFDV